MLNKTTGHYKILEEIGQGTTGTVYLAEHLLFKQKFAIKALSSRLKLLKGIESGVSNLSMFPPKIEHRNINRIYEFFKDQKIHFIVMDYIIGKGLNQIIKQKGSFNEDEAAQILKQILIGLSFAHKKGYVHGALKPSNIIVTEFRDVKIMDLGLGSILKDIRSIMPSDYMSPEQLTNPKKVDRQSDIYSVGIIVLEMLSGNVPYKKKSFFFSRKKKQQSPISYQLLKEKNPNISHSFAQIILKALETNPHYRYRDCEEFLNAIEAYEKSEERRLRNTKDVPVNQDTEKIVKEGSQIEEITALDSEPLKEGVAESKIDLDTLIRQVRIIRNRRELGHWAWDIVKALLVVSLLIITGSLIWYILQEKQAKEREYLAAEAEKSKSVESIREDDLAYWRSTKANTKESYQEYLKLYPQGRHVSHVEEVLKEIAKQEKTFRQDDLVFREAKRINTAESYRNYLGKFPNGRHTSEAYKEINNIQVKETEEHREALAIQQDNLAFQQAESFNTEHSYSNYLKLYPHGRHSAEARIRIEFLSRELIVSNYESGKYPTISEALRKASNGARILVRPGRYRESIVIDKNVDIIGDGPMEQIVIFSSQSYCFSMQSDRATVRNLTIQSLAADNYAVDIPKGRLLLENCDITANKRACIGISGIYTEPVIKGCRIHDGKESGIIIYDYGKGTIENCEIFRTTNTGVCIESNGNPTIRKCKIFNCKANGINIYNLGKGTIEDCEIFNNKYPGINITTGANPHISNCSIHGQEIGIQISDNVIATIEKCDLRGNSLRPWFIEEGCQVHEMSTNILK